MKPIGDYEIGDIVVMQMTGVLAKFAGKCVSTQRQPIDGTPKSDHPRFKIVGAEQKFTSYLDTILKPGDYVILPPRPKRYKTYKTYEELFAAFRRGELTDYVLRMDSDSCSLDYRGYNGFEPDCNHCQALFRGNGHQDIVEMLVAAGIPCESV